MIYDSPEENVDSAAQVIADAVRRGEQVASEVQVLEVNEPADSLLARVLRADERVEVTNLEHYLGNPRRATGNAQLYDGGDFSAYVNRLAGDATTVWADEDNGRFVAVFNDHTDPGIPGWRDHVATLLLKNDPEWTAWLRTDGVWLSHGKFAEFLQDRASSIISPDPAAVLEIVLDFKAHRKADFDGEVDLDHDTVRFSYTEELKQKTNSGTVELPRELHVRLAPYLGMAPVEMVASIRWDVDREGMKFGYRIHRPDLVKRAAFAQLRNEIEEGVAPRPVFLGATPQGRSPF